LTKVTNIKFKKLFKRFLAVVLIACVFIGLAFVSLVVALQFPAVQTRLVKKATVYASDLLHYPIRIEAVDINWFDEIRLENVSVYDRHGSRMIFLKNASVDFTLHSLLHPQLDVEKVTLANGKVMVYKYKKDNSVNITDFIESIREAASPKKSAGKAKVFTIPEVELENMYFSYYDQRREFIKGFDHNHFSFAEINADVTNLRIIADTFQIQINNLNSIEEKTKLKVHQADLNFLVTKYNMVFDDIAAHIGDSHLGKYLKFEYNNINELTDFNEKINMVAHLDSCHVYSKDLGLFNSTLLPYNDFATISGNLKGKVVNFSVKNLQMGFGKGSFIAGRAAFKGLPELQETYIDFKFNKSKVNTGDLKQYFPDGSSSYEIIQKFGTIAGTGEFVGFPYDFVTHGNFSTGLGKLNSDLNFKLVGDQHPKATYKGALVTSGFHVGKFFDVEDKVGIIDMNGKIEGSGLTLDQAEMKVDAKVSRIDVNRYAYKNIVTNATLSNGLFDGFISVDDPNLNLSANGLINLRNNANKFDIDVNFHKANLKPLHITELDTYFISDFDLNFTGLKPDEIVGEMSFSNTYLSYQDDKEIFIKSLFAKSTKENGHRDFLIKSDLLDFEAKGNFEFTQVYDDLLTLWKEYSLNIENDKVKITQYYQNKKKHNRYTHYDLAFFADIKNLNNLFSVYVPGLYISQNTLLNGEFSNGHTSVLNLTSHVDTLYFKENTVYEGDIELSTSKLSDSSNVLAMFYAKSPKQQLKDLPPTENFSAEGVWNDGEINFSGSMKQADSPNDINLKGNLSLVRHQQKVLQFTGSGFNLLNKHWSINDENRIYFTTEGIIFNNFSLVNENQKLHLHGMISDNPDKEARLEVKDFQLSTINPLLKNNNIAGTVNADFTIKNILNDVNFDGALNVDDLKLENFLIGDIQGQSSWNNTLQQLEVKVDVNREGENIVGIGGFVKRNSNEKAASLSLDVNLDKARLEILNPIFKGILSDVSGTASGKFRVGGTTDNIMVKGRADVREGRFKVDYLNTTYYFDDFIYMDENLIGFKKLRLKDAYGDLAILNGGIFHDNFSNFMLDMRAYVDNFQVLNTTEKDNELFYGTAFVTGDVELTGAFEDFAINANATSNKGTRIYIPIMEYGDIEEKNFISFTKQEDSKTLEKVNKPKVDLSGIKMDFNLDITPDAYAEIIFDKHAGDNIRGYGSGNLKLQIDTRGDFFLYGTYNMLKGGYNFTLANIINKEFTILPNSSITWYGDPYKGVLDLDAYYHQLASVSPLISDSATAAQEQSRKYPVHVLLGINGNLLSPDIDLGIKIMNYSGLSANYVTQFIANIENNEQELNRQVFSLLILQGFSPISSTSTSGINAARNLSELFTNQLGNWLSQVDDNLQIDMDLNSLDRDALNNFNLRLSYTLLDGRLKISRDGKFSNNQAGSSNLSNIAGEWTIEYLLSTDGRLRLKLYNKNSQNQILSALNNNTSPSAGFSVLHTESFNSLTDLFRRKRNKSKLPLVQMQLSPDTKDSPDTIRFIRNPGDTVSP
jgi:hypothetical protein